MHFFYVILAFCKTQSTEIVLVEPWSTVIIRGWNRLGLYVDKQWLLRNNYRGPRLNKYDQNVIHSQKSVDKYGANRRFKFKAKLNYYSAPKDLSKSLHKNTNVSIPYLWFLEERHTLSSQVASCKCESCHGYSFLWSGFYFNLSRFTVPAIG